MNFYDRELEIDRLRGWSSSTGAEEDEGGEASADDLSSTRVAAVCQVVGDLDLEGDLGALA